MMLLMLAAMPLALLPKPPELNGRVERMQATWRYELYAVYDPPRQIDKLADRRLRPPIQHLPTA